nr:ribonuclease H-like domain-containing protein [Tanacetum cinerariifolium]
MSQDVITVGSTMRILLLYRGEYLQWRERFMNYLEEQTDVEAMIKSIQNDPKFWTVEEKKTRKIDRLARSLLIQGFPNDIYSIIDSNETAKDLWDALERQMRGSEVGFKGFGGKVLKMYSNKHKFHADGTLSCYKARLVANGSSQQLGVDFDETFSPVVKPATIRTVLSLVMSRKWPIHQLDVKNDFLNDGLLETVYMHQPPGFVDARVQTGSRRGSGSGSYFVPKYCSGLQYLTFTRQDLSYAVKQICLYMHDPREPHLAALKCILRYVQDSLDLGLHLYASSTTSLVGYTNVDWAGCPSTRRSTSGYCVFLGDNLLSWSIKRQHTLSCFGAEAEYQGVANVVAETTWLRNLLRELHSPLSTATLVYYDNVSAIYMAANPVQLQRTQHIEIDIHFVRDMVTA